MKLQNLERAVELDKEITYVDWIINEQKNGAITIPVKLRERTEKLFIRYMRELEAEVEKL